MPQAKAFFSEDISTAREDQTARFEVIPGGRSQAERGERRSARRIPVTCQVKIRITDSDETAYGTTKDISVGGVGLITDYVPRFGQLMEIHVLPPQGSNIKPLRALVQVRRCVQLITGHSYEIGAAILKIRE
ncbi:MAG: PilZ domain-containing protein [Sulfuricella sp.]|nr:PilZ domain-containing protein [Sulfuricella sp.]